jgi:hypothetical protein
VIGHEAMVEIFASAATRMRTNAGRGRIVPRAFSAFFHFESGFEYHISLVVIQIYGEQKKGEVRSE